MDTNYTCRPKTFFCNPVYSKEMAVLPLISAIETSFLHKIGTCHEMLAFLSIGTVSLNSRW